MQIQINTDRNIGGHQGLISQVSATVTSALDRFSDHITRVEIHLSDENGHNKSLNDKHCVMEARLRGHQPLAVTQQAMTLKLAVEGAVEKLTKLIESTIGRLRDKKSHRASPYVSRPDLTEQ